jgi:hypothetical protein
MTEEKFNQDDEISLYCLSQAHLEKEKGSSSQTCQLFHMCDFFHLLQLLLFLLSS